MEQEYVETLHSLIANLEQQRARISIQGRALTTEEQSQLDTIENALPHLEKARAILDASTSKLNRPDEEVNEAQDFCDH